MDPPELRTHPPELFIHLGGVLGILQICSCQLAIVPQVVPKLATSRWSPMSVSHFHIMELDLKWVHMGPIGPMGPPRKISKISTFFGFFRPTEKMGREGPKWGGDAFLRHKKNLADNLGRTDFDFENF